MTVAVDRDDGGVDHGVFHVRIISYRIEYALENARLRPVVEALEHRVPFTERRRKITPGTPRSGLPEDCLKKQAGVPSAATWIRNLAEAMRFHLRPLSIGQYQAHR
jgi:hypothetical protein